MSASPRLLLAVLAAAVALVAIGCGDSKKDTKTTTTAPAPAASTTLDSATYQSLNSGAGALSTSLSAIGVSAKKCATKATKGEQAVRTCVADSLQTATDKIADLAGTVEADAAKVTGPCKTQLSAFAKELRAVVTTFEAGTKQIASGDLQAGADEIKNIDVAGLTTTGNAAQNACRPTAS